jgi:hypothetical protein
MTELERALVALGSQVDFPATPNLWARVEPRLQRRRWVRPAVFATAVAAVAIGIAFAVPPARSAILKFFHLGAATVERVETLPPAQEKSKVAGLGPALVREDAEMYAHLGIRLPPGVQPARYYARPGLIATFVRYEDKPVLLAEIRGDQMGLFKKFVSSDTTVEPVAQGEFGLWISGGPHVVMWLDSGAMHRVATRLAGNVLLWLRNGVTYRLEGDLDEDQMLALARQITR